MHEPSSSLRQHSAPAAWAEECRAGNGKRNVFTTFLVLLGFVRTADIEEIVC